MLTYRNVLILFNLICLFELKKGYIVEPGPKVIATKGEVWPKPQQQIKSDQFFIVRPHSFDIEIKAHSCNTLQNAVQRYLDIIKGSTAELPKLKHFAYKGEFYKPWRNDANFAGYLDSLDVVLTTACNDELPTHTMTEHYSLVVEGTANGTQCEVSGSTIWGVLRGLETFSQLLYATENEALKINHTTIYDFPRFSHRGLLIDTARHFIPVQKILKTLDAMAYNKLNVFHWHITDDQSFPYESKKYPQLSQKGAYADKYTYSSEEVQKIIKYAAARGIRVLVEFDTPGHTRSWGVAMPELLTPCYKNGTLSGQYGPMDPTKKSTYSFLADFFTEVIGTFPDQYIHLGADEVEFECWESNPDINRFMQKFNISTYSDLEDFYIQNLLNITNNLKAKTIVWEEVFTNGVKIPDTTVVHVWKDWGIGWPLVTYNATKAGYPVLLSACWYLDHLATGGDWNKYYQCDPHDFPGSEQQKALVVGGEACMWAESVNEYNIESRVWPRASATAEKLWSVKNADTISNAAKRLEEHTCRMNKRGIMAQPPNGPGVCL